MSQPEAAHGVAVVGMACVFPGAPDLDSYWRNIRQGVDAISEVPAARWDPLFYAPDSSAVDRFYCRRGGFVDGLLSVDALGLGIMPVAAKGAEPDQLAALQVAVDAMADAGYADRPFARERTGVILGRGNYIGAGMTRLEQQVRTAEQLVSALRDLLPELDEQRLGEVKAEFQSKLVGYGPDTAIGLVPNLTASRIANRLDLGGPAYTLDAACASSLLAVEHAMQGLREGRLDLAIAGGAHLSHDLAFWSVFTQLGALSRTQQIRPFDRRADGLLIGEGIGLLVLKRLSDAERDGDRVYAVLSGVGVASDGRGASIMNPSPAGQLLALQRAWAQSGLDPASVHLVEAHGTGTPVGDAAELSTLNEHFGPLPPGSARAALGSVKSMIGHTMPAAGAAALIKAVLAVHHRVLPPSLHCEQPTPLLERGRFEVPSVARPGPQQGPMIAGVNAFGFGGINAHVVVRSHDQGSGRRRSQAREELLWLARDSREALARALSEGAPSGGSGSCRLALVDPSPARRERALKAIEAGQPQRGRDGLYLGFEGLLKRGGLAFLCPGVEAVQAEPLPDVAAWLGRAAPLLTEGSELERRGAQVVENGRLLAAALERAGVRPDQVAGHSSGEWTGMMIAGHIPAERVEEVLASLAPGSLEVPGVAFLSVGAGRQRVEEILGLPLPLELTHDNCPHQVVLCGEQEAALAARDRLVQAKVLAHILPFRSGFHAPFFAPYLAEHQQRLGSLPLGPPRLPLWSATTAGRYPSDEAEIRHLAVEHLVKPVRFRELTLALYEAGVRVFVQLGTGSLAGFVSDTLRGLEHLSLSAAEPQRSGKAQLQRTLAALFVEGAEVDPGCLYPKPSARLPLDLGVPLVRLSTPLPTRVQVGPGGGGPVLEGFRSLSAELERSRAAVEAAFRKGRTPVRAERTEHRLLSVQEQPFLFDHSLIPQPPGWPVVADWNPVVPMTMSVRMMMEAAAELRPGMVASGVEQVRAHRWMGVEPPVELELHCRVESEGPDQVRVRVRLGDYADGVVLLSPAWPRTEPCTLAPLDSPEPCEVDARRLYDERWMFHGPGYHAVAGLDEIGAEGVDGRLRALAAEGALLDGAGQLLGYWVMARMERDRLAMPVRIEALRFFGPEPSPGEELRCRVRLRSVGAQQIRADLELDRGGVLWCRIEGWTDWRFETDDRLWPVMQRTERHLFAELFEGGLALVEDRGRSTSSRDYLARRFLSREERAALEALPLRQRAGWLLERIAARDAVRALAGRELFPVEVGLEEQEDGRLLAQVEGSEPWELDHAAWGEVGVAIATRGHRPGLAIGPAGEDVEASRLHLAREALRRARLPEEGGSLELVERQGERVCLDGIWVETMRRGDAVVAWTVG